MPRVRLSTARKRNVAKKLIGNKPKALQGGASKAERKLYSQIISIKKRRTRRKIASKLAKKKPTGTNRRIVKKSKTSNKNSKKHLTEKRLSFNLQQAIKRARGETQAMAYTDSNILHYHEEIVARKLRLLLKKQGFSEKKIAYTLNKLKLKEKK